MDRHDRQPPGRPPDKWAALLTLLALLPWLLVIGGGISMCLLYEPGERIDAIGYGILGFIFLALLVGLLVPIVASSWRRYLDIDCRWCGRPFYSSDRRRIRQTGCCPGCGRSVPREDLEDLE